MGNRTWCNQSGEYEFQRGLRNVCLEEGEILLFSQLTKQLQTCINQAKLYQLSLGGSKVFCSSHVQTFACYFFCAIEERDQATTVTQEGSSMICFYL